MEKGPRFKLREFVLSRNLGETLNQYPRDGWNVFQVVWCSLDNAYTVILAREKGFDDED